MHVADERRAIVRIDEQPSGKKFQGVWLEHADGSRWVIAYRPHVLWTWFADREVIVTGGCYQPVGQAIGATHFRVDTMRGAVAQLGHGPYLSIGPEQLVRGELIREPGPAGSKLAGSARAVFRDADGASYGIANDQAPTRTGPVRVRARVVEPDPSYAARTSGPDLWIVSVHDVDHEDDPRHTPSIRPCP